MRPPSPAGRPTPRRSVRADAFRTRGVRVRDHLHPRPAPARRPASAVICRIVAAAGTALVVLAATAPATAAYLAPAVPAGAGSLAPAGTAAAGRPVLLINGDRLVIRRTPGGRRAVTLLPAPGPQSIISLSSGR